METEEKKEPEVEKEEENKSGFASDEEAKNQENSNNINVEEEKNPDDPRANLPESIRNINLKPPYEDDDEDDEPQFAIRRKLLTIENPRKYGNRLIQDYNYNAEGENGLFEAQPRIVKFSGFIIRKKDNDYSDSKLIENENNKSSEMNKSDNNNLSETNKGTRRSEVYTQKIKIINKSKFSERIIILPPTSKFFKIKYSKRGTIPPGLCEVITLTFKPKEYQYYTDNICINCNCQKIIIPIHAYPRINPYAKDYIPKEIDLGNVTLSTVKNKEICVNNVIDIPFNYEISKTGNECEEIKLSPMAGEFKPLDTTRLILSVEPKKYGIFRQEFLFKTSEIDFVPYVFSVFATCHNFKRGRVFDEESKGETDNMTKEQLLKSQSKSQSKTGITGTATRKRTKLSHVPSKEPSEASNIIEPDENGQPEEHKLEEGEKSQKENEKENLLLGSTGNSFPPGSKVSGLSKTLSKFKDFPSNIEKEYLKYYNDCDSIIQSKEFKYLRFIGKPPLTEEEVGNIMTEREQRKDHEITTKATLDKNLHVTELDKEKCEVDRDLKYYLKPNFNENQNDDFFKTRHYYNVFLKAMSKVIIKKRARKVLDKIKEMNEKFNIKTPDDYEKFCEKDWLDYYAKDQNGEDDSLFNFMKFTFNPTTQKIHRETLYLTNEYSINSLKQKVTHDNNLNLDEFSQFEPNERDDVRVCDYKSFVNPGLTQFDIDLGEKPLRPPCESEGMIRLQRGDTELIADSDLLNKEHQAEKAQQELLEKQAQLQKDSKGGKGKGAPPTQTTTTTTSEETKKEPEKPLLLYDLADTYKEHALTTPDDVVFNNTALKHFTSSNVTTDSLGETDVDFNLRYRTISGCYTPISNYQNEIYYSIAQTHFTDSRDIDNECVLIHSGLNYTSGPIPRMKALDEKDLNIKKKEKVDEDNYLFELTRDDDANILSMYDKEDENAGKLRELNKDGTVDKRKNEKVENEKKMILHKRKWMSTVPTVMEYFNSGVVNPNNKLII